MMRDTSPLLSLYAGGEWYHATLGMFYPAFVWQKRFYGISGLDIRVALVPF